jgi:crotonobetainyl-CoA:carnitine CoA-transferase CaiB-like acyl-CoA transferase
MKAKIRRAPELGENNEEILSRIGYTKEEIGKK